MPTGRMIGLAAVAAGVLSPTGAAAQEVPEPVFEAQDAFARPDASDPFAPRERPELLATGVRLGQFILRPSVEVAALANTDVRLLPFDGDGDVGFSVAPRATLNSVEGPRRISAFVEAEAIRYLSETTDNVETLFGGVAVDQPLGATGALRASIEGGRLIEDRAAVFTPRDLRSPVEFDRIVGTLSGTQSFGRVVLAPAIRIDRLAYHDGRRATDPSVVVLQRDRSQVRVVPSLLAGYVVSGNTAFYLGAEVNRRNYDLAQTPDRDSRGYVVYGGARVRPSSLTRLDVAIGYLRQSYAAPLADPEGLFFRATLDWAPTALTSVQMRVRRDAPETGALQLGGAIRTRLNGSVTHELLRNLNLTAGAEVAVYRISLIDRTDRRFFLNAGARYIASRTFDLFAQADQVIGRGGEGAPVGSDLERTRLVAGAALKL